MRKLTARFKTGNWQPAEAIKMFLPLATQT
jgi:hypothetical protein